MLLLTYYSHVDHAENGLIDQYFYVWISGEFNVDPTWETEYI